MSGGSNSSQFARQVSLRITGEAAERGKLAALMSGGTMFVQHADPAPSGYVLVNFVLPNGGAAYRVVGEVTGVRRQTAEHPSGMQLKLVRFDENAQALIAAYRQKREAEAAQAEADTRAKARSISREMPAITHGTAAFTENVGAKKRREEVPADEPIIGIDLGTTNSCAAIVKDGKPVIIQSPEGYETIPSVLYIESASEAYVGHRAVQKMLLAPDKAIYGSKRFIGRPFTSQEVKTFGHFFRYGLVPDARGMAAAKLGERVIPLEAVAALILKQIQNMASAALGRNVTRCVITVPAYFGETQRQAVFEAGRMAGLNVDRVLSEPTAAAVAYGFGRGVEQTIVVYDLGGGTFDASVVKIRGENMEVLATEGDAFLGGSDFDDRLTEYLCMLIQQKHGINVRTDVVTLHRVRQAAEAAKHVLSQRAAAPIELPHLARGSEGPIHFQAEVSREQYDSITLDLVQRSIRVVDDILKQVGIKARDIDDVVLAGGQSRCAQVRRMLEERFSKKPSMRVHPDHAVAIGAALVAAASFGRVSVELTDILPASIHLETEDRSGVLLPKGTKLPTRTTFALEASVGLDTKFSCTLYRGEKPRLHDNQLLGTVALPSTLTEAIEGAAATVLVDVSADGLLTLAMRHPTTAEINSLQLRLAADAKTTDDVGDFAIKVDDGLIIPG